MRPGPGLISYIAIAKYCDGLPLYRLSKMFEREGVEIDRMVMVDWMGHLAWWIDPIAEMIAQHVMASPVIHADDTPIKVLSPGRGRTITGRFWNYVVDERPWGGARAHIYTIIESAKLSGLNPHAYLAGIIDKMAKGWPRSRLAELLPWNWTATIAAEAAATEGVIATAA